MMRQLTEECIWQDTENKKRQYEIDVINSILFCFEEEIIFLKAHFPTFFEKNK